MRLICIESGFDILTGFLGHVEEGNVYTAEAECHEDDPEKHHYHISEIPPPINLFYAKLFIPLSEVDERDFVRETISDNKKQLA